MTGDYISRSNNKSTFVTQIWSRLRRLLRNPTGVYRENRRLISWLFTTKKLLKNRSYIFYCPRINTQSVYQWSSLLIYCQHMGAYHSRFNQRFEEIFLIRIHKTRFWIHYQVAIQEDLQNLNNTDRTNEELKLIQWRLSTNSRLL